MSLKKSLLYSILFINNCFFSQNYIFEIPWSANLPVTINEETFLMPIIQGHGNDNGLPMFYEKSKLKSRNFSAFVTNEEYEAAPESDLPYLNKLHFNCQENAKIDYKVTSAGNEHFFVVSIIPYRQINGKLERLKKVEFQLKDEKPQGKPKDFVSNSVLKDGSGFWYKIALTKDGIYKLDKSFLEACGINTNGLMTSSINIFGNGEGVLPELNSAFRTDDLAKNAIYISGDSDGYFDENDYILFYGWGPHRWYANGTTEFDQKRNIYSDYSYYFININPNDTPKRIENLQENPNPSNVTIESYDYRDIYENDLVNLVGGGQRWYGELFDLELDRYFNFSIPNIDTNDIQFKVSLATNSRLSSGTSQKYFVNNQLLLETNLPTTGIDYVRSNQKFNLKNPSSTLQLKVAITRNNPSTLTYLDRILINTKRKLIFYDTQFGFRTLKNTQPSQIALYKISNFPATGFVWDLSDRQNPKKITGTLASNILTFKTENSYKEFVASNGSSFYTPERIGVVDQQNLHGLSQVDFLIITPNDFISQANRLADLHRAKGTTTHVVRLDHIYNEFSSGAPDAGAIRMFAKMFYDRAALNPSTKPKYLLLFGDGTYDPKNRIASNNNFVLTYQVENSENHISALVTDDFYGMLDDNEAIAASDLLDIGIGRLLISTNEHAKQQVDKIEHYMKNGSTLFNSNIASCCLDNNNSTTFGDWRLKFLQIADDEESGYFLNVDTEPQYNLVKKNYHEMNCDKLYLDAFKQETSAGGERFPDVYDAITDRVQRGQLIVNYVGHGGEVGLAEERIVTIPQINSWTNINHLNLFVSATCEFTKFDDPSRVSAGEWVSLNPKGGAIALMTTSRSVFFGVNSSTGKAFFQNVFQRNTDGSALTFGEIVKRTKNASGSSDNKRSFTLIGDPALKIALPNFKILTDSINGKNQLVEIDTLKALSSVNIKGHIADYNNNILSNFNGTLIPTVFDKAKTYVTLGQDVSSPKIEYELQKNIVYRGKVSVKNGKFDFNFVVPKDIALSIDFGKISYYAYNETNDAVGYDTNFRIGGISQSSINDQQGPQIELFLNDEKFISGSPTDETPVLLMKLFDENGINTVGTGIGHDIIATLDGNTSEPIVLNDYYTSNLDSYQSGEVRYAFSKLQSGKHTLDVKVWDVNNNSSSAQIEFIVNEKKSPVLNHVYNYPNPFTSYTEFMFEHNQSCSSLDAQVQIYTISGKLIKTINKTIATKGFRSDGISWDGLDEFGDPLARGVYVYRLKIKTDSDETAEKIEKLVILK